MALSTSVKFYPTSSTTLGELRGSPQLLAIDETCGILCIGNGVRVDCYHCGCTGPGLSSPDARQPVSLPYIGYVSLLDLTSEAPILLPQATALAFISPGILAVGTSSTGQCPLVLVFRLQLQVSWRHALRSGPSSAGGEAPLLTQCLFRGPFPPAAPASPDNDGTSACSVTCLAVQPPTAEGTRPVFVACSSCSDSFAVFDCAGGFSTPEIAIVESRPRGDARLCRHQGGIASASFTAAGEWLATASVGDDVHVWRCGSNESSRLSVDPRLQEPAITRQKILRSERTGGGGCAVVGMRWVELLHDDEAEEEGDETPPPCGAPRLFTSHADGSRKVWDVLSPSSASATLEWPLQSFPALGSMSTRASANHLGGIVSAATAAPWRNLRIRRAVDGKGDGQRDSLTVGNGRLMGLRSMCMGEESLVLSNHGEEWYMWPIRRVTCDIKPRPAAVAKPTRPSIMRGSSITRRSRMASSPGKEVNLTPLQKTQRMKEYSRRLAPVSQRVMTATPKKTPREEETTAAAPSTTETYPERRQQQLLFPSLAQALNLEHFNVQGQTARGIWVTSTAASEAVAPPSLLTRSIMRMCGCEKKAFDEDEAEDDSGSSQQGRLCAVILTEKGLSFVTAKASPPEGADLRHYVPSSDARASPAPVEGAKQTPDCIGLGEAAVAITPIAHIDDSAKCSADHSTVDRFAAARAPCSSPATVGGAAARRLNFSAEGEAVAAAATDSQTGMKRPATFSVKTKFQLPEQRGGVAEVEDDSDQPELSVVEQAKQLASRVKEMESQLGDIQRSFALFAHDVNHQMSTVLLALQKISAAR